MRNTLLALLGVGVLALSGYAAASTLDGAAPARTVSLPGVTTGETTTGVTTTTGEADDVSGPCDEAEHGDDSRCAGAVATGDEDGERGGGDDDDNDDDEDRSGSNSGRG